MLNSRIDLFDQKWIDAVFEGRNKKYGAYELRRQESKMTIRALIIGALLFTFLISLPVIINQIQARRDANRVNIIDDKVVVVDILPPPERPEELFVPPAPPAAEAKTSQDVRKFTNPVVAPETEVYEEILSQDSLKKVVAGSRNIDAQDDGEIVIGERPVDYDVTEDGTGYGNQVFHAVQVMPQYPGGEPKFIQYVANELQNSTYQITSKIAMEFSFIIEKDGRLTDVEIVNNGGNKYLAEKAVEVLLKSRPWSPGINNGQAVRVKYSLPIVIQPPTM